MYQWALDALTTNTVGLERLIVTLGPFGGARAHAPLVGRLAGLARTSVLWTTEDPYEREANVRGSAAFDLVFTNDRATVAAYGGRANHLALGASSLFHDLAVIEDGSYRIMGRLSVDIIKSGGYKLSALEIEAALLDHPSIRECAVVGLPDETWGEVVAVAAVRHDGADLETEELVDWSRERLSHYKIPRRVLLLDSLPQLLWGLVVTLQIGVASIFCGLAGGLFLAVARLYAPAFFKVLIRIYVDFFRSIPLLVLLIVVYYALPFVGIKLSPFLSAVTALSLVSAAYTAEIFRAGIEAIPNGQFEASAARSPLGRGTTPDEIADALMFLLNAPAITGQMLALDGGRHISWPERSGPTPRK